MPPTMYPTIETPAPPKKSRTRLVVAIILIVIVAGVFIGYVAFLNYQSNQVQTLQTEKNADKTAASQAPSQLVFTCFIARNDTSHLYHASFGWSGYMTISEEFGVSNPTRFIMEGTWTLTLYYPSVGWNLVSNAFIQESANGMAYPTFVFQITSSQFSNLPPNPDFSRFTATLDGTYLITGTYNTYSATSHSTYDSTTSSGTGALGHRGNLSAC